MPRKARPKAPDVSNASRRDTKKGTKPWIRFDEPIRIPPGQLMRSKYVEDFYVMPMIGTPGKNWTGRIIFKDQFHRPYKSGEFEFVWTGPTELPSQSTPKLEEKS
jgi:hypothetical protein